MFDPRYPWLAVAFLTLVASGGLVYYAAIVVGFYKDPLMARLRLYGSETHYSPLCRFLLLLGTWSLMVSSMLDSLTMNSRSTWLYAPAVFLTIALMAFGFSLIAYQRLTWREAFPRWYDDLLHGASRQERRQIAFAWLRLPAALRWRLNGDQASFRVWTDMVRITVFYGARDPDNPWAVWE